MQHVELGAPQERSTKLALMSVVASAGGFVRQAKAASDYVQAELSPDKEVLSGVSISFYDPSHLELIRAKLLVIN